MQIQIAKFELYPTNEPIGYAVGFNVTTGNNRQFYRDTVVSLESAQGKSDEEIVGLGWQDLQVGIEAEVIRLEAKSNLLGNTWTPPVTKTELISLINQAQALYDSAVEGTEPGQYDEGSKALLLDTIETVSIVRDNPDTTQEGVNNAINILQQSLTVFADSIN